MTRPSLLLLIPAYNEADRIGPVLRDYARHFEREYQGKFQIVVVLNGCQDSTLDVVHGVARDFSCVHYLEYREPIGKGGALIEGMKLSSIADFVGYVDADGATAPKSFLELVRELERNSQFGCVIGSRWIPGAVLHQEQTRKRQVASRAFHLIVQLLFWMNIHDTQCGAKVMRREAIERIHSSLRIADMAFDINLLFSLKRAGYRILEVPTEWTDKIGSKVTLGATSLVMFLSALRVRLIYSPFYGWLRPLRPLEGWIYRKLSQPQPRPGPPLSEHSPAKSG